MVSVISRLKAQLALQISSWNRIDWHKKKLFGSQNFSRLYCNFFTKFVMAVKDNMSKCDGKLSRRRARHISRRTDYRWSKLVLEW
jgi:hypothetical protein